MADRRRSGRCGAHWSEAEFGHELLDCYRRLVNVHSAEYERAEHAYRKLTKDNFDPAKAHINGALKRHLGERRAAPYLIGKLDPIPGTRYHRYGLALPAAAITIAASLPAERRALLRPYRPSPDGLPVVAEEE